MRREYGQVLRKLVDQEMRAAAFGWEAVSLKSLYVGAGERLYRKDAGGGMHLWCILIPDQKFDRFTLEVGWSRRARFPELSMRPSRGSPAQSHGMDETIVRLGTLAFGHDHWWVVEEFRVPAGVEELSASLQPISAAVAESRVAPRVAEAVQALQTAGQPFLHAVTQRHV